MKKLLISNLIAVCVGSLILVGNVSALSLPLDPKYDIVNPDNLEVKPTYTAGVDLGYFIWTDDVQRTSWNVFWSGDKDGVPTDGLGPEAGDHNFTGSITLFNNELIAFERVNWEFRNDQDVLTISSTGDLLDWDAWANFKQDGFTFDIQQLGAPAYVAFELSIDGSMAKAAQYTFLGGDNTAGTDGSFAVAAPVPEPATMLIFGTGLIGLVTLRRRR